MRIPPQRIDLYDAGVPHHSGSPVRCNRKQIPRRKTKCSGPDASGKGREDPELLEGNAIKVSMHAVAQRNIFTAIRPQNRYTVEHSRAFAD